VLSNVVYRLPQAGQDNELVRQSSYDMMNSHIVRMSATMAGPGKPKTGGGSRKGKPNKLTAALKDMVLSALHEAGGVEYLKRMADENPGAFMTLLGKVLPLQLAGGPNGEAIQISVVDYAVSTGVPRA
jgi:hypothetical protein